MSTLRKDFRMDQYLWSCNIHIAYMWWSWWAGKLFDANYPVLKRAVIHPRRWNWKPSCLLGDCIETSSSKPRSMTWKTDISRARRLVGCYGKPHQRGSQSLPAQWAFVWLKITSLTWNHDLDHPNSFVSFNHLKYLQQLQHDLSMLSHSVQMNCRPGQRWSRALRWTGLCGVPQETVPIKLTAVPIAGLHRLSTCPKNHCSSWPSAPPSSTSGSFLFILSFFSWSAWFIVSRIISIVITIISLDCYWMLLILERILVLIIDIVSCFLHVAPSPHWQCFEGKTTGILWSPGSCSSPSRNSSG